MNSTFRLTSDQEKLYIASGGKKDKNGNWYGGNGKAAIPGFSWHEYGEAVDVKNESLRNLYGSYAATKDQTKLLKYGIYKSQTSGNDASYLEDWHIQPIETESVRYRDIATKMSYYKAFHPY